MKNFLVLGLWLVSCNSGFTPYTQGMPDISNNASVIAGTITLDSKLASKVSPGDTIFVMAKSGEVGPPMAVKKFAASKFPMPFELGSADMMMPGHAFQGEYFVIVRVDKDGMAGPAQPGDLEGKTSKPVKVGSASVEVKINKVY